MTDHISDLCWDRWLAGELSADDTAATLSHAAQCTRCGERMRALSAERDRFAARPMPISFARARRFPRWLAAPILAAAAVLVVVLRPAPDAERTKGARGPTLSVITGALVPLSTGDAIHPGDALQAMYASDRDGFGPVISRDGAGTISTYVPSRGGVLAPLPAGEHEFPESTILDAVVGTETLYVIWCPTAQPLAPLLAAVTSDALDDGDGCHHRKLVLEKRP